MSNHQHYHQHEHGHHEHFDPGTMYKEPWVQQLIQTIQEYLVDNHAWCGIDPSTKQRVLDYACGHGTISGALVKLCPQSEFQGIDNHPAQVKRYNEEAAKLLGEQSDRMHGIEGDISSPSSELDAKQWFEFDVAIISMALHHVPNPVDMLKQLRKRLRNGGRLVVVEWIRKDSLESNTTQDAQTSPLHDFQQQYDPDNMVEVIGGQKIWEGFTVASLRSDFNAAGFSGIDVKVHPQDIWLPEQMDKSGKARRVVFAKGTYLPSHPA